MFSCLRNNPDFPCYTELSLSLSAIPEEILPNKSSAKKQAPHRTPHDATITYF
jgi:hypothetical protein